MTLAAKGSRRIVVDGVAYRWRLRHKPTYAQGLCESPCIYAVELAERPGARLVVRTSRPRPDNWLGRPGASVLPSEVARSVRSALACGWTPAADGSTFMLHS